MYSNKFVDLKRIIPRNYMVHAEISFQYTGYECTQTHKCFS